MVKKQIDVQTMLPFFESFRALLVKVSERLFNSLSLNHPESLRNEHFEMELNSDHISSNQYM